MPLITVNHFSVTLLRNIPCTVILPESAGYSPKAIPVLWLLHGKGDDHTTWSRKTSIERYANERGLAVVMPNGENSNYSNMAHGHPYYNYIAKELPELLGGMFNLSPRREDNFIAGNSMGGGGALKIGLANPDTFSAIGCFSAGDVVFPFPNSKPGDKPEIDSLVYQFYDGKEIEGTEEDVLGSARKILENGLPAPRIFHAIGNNDFLLEHAHRTRDFFTSLDGNPFDYTYIEDEGEHCWEYWDKHIVDFLEYIMK